MGIVLNTDKKWLIISLLGLGLLFATIFAPFLSYKWGDGINFHKEYVYFDGDWKTIDIDQSGETVDVGDFQDWEGHFSPSSPILLLIGICITILASLALIFEISDLWKLSFRVINLLSSSLGFIGALLYIPFAIYVVHIEHVTFTVTATFVIVSLTLLLIALFNGYSLFGNIVKNREKRLERKSM